MARTSGSSTGGDPDGAVRGDHASWRSVPSASVTSSYGDLLCPVCLRPSREPRSAVTTVDAAAAMTVRHAPFVTFVTFAEGARPRMLVQGRQASRGARASVQRARRRRPSPRGQIQPGNHIRTRQDEYGMISAARIG